MLLLMLALLPLRSDCGVAAPPLSGTNRVRTFAPAFAAPLFSRARAQMRTFAVAKTMLCGTPVDPDRGDICGGTFWLEEGVRPSCAVEEAVEALRLSPAVAPLLPSDRFVGSEWWMQWRPCEQGMGLHVDADVGLFELEEHRLADGRFGGVTRTAFVSSVTFFGSVGGPTLVLDQRFGEAHANSRAATPARPAGGELIFPRANTLALFNGSLVHGVLPATASGVRRPPEDEGEDGGGEVESEVPVGGSGGGAGCVGGRTTLLVNFWLDAPPTQAMPVRQEHLQYFGMPPPQAAIPIAAATPSGGGGNGRPGSETGDGMVETSVVGVSSNGGSAPRPVIDMRRHADWFEVQYKEVEGRQLPAKVSLRVPHARSVQGLGRRGGAQVCTMLWDEGGETPT